MNDEVSVLDRFTEFVIVTFVAGFIMETDDTTRSVDGCLTFL